MANNQRRFFGSFYPIVALVVALSLTLMLGCGEDYNTPSGPEEVQESLLLSPDNPQIRAVMAIQDRHTEEIMSKPGVVGIATGLNADGQPAIIIFMESQTLAKKAFLPDEFESVPVIVQVTGPIKALKGKPPGNGDNVDPTARFDRPVPIGVSTGHPAITAGTIGCRVTDGANVYALTNNHVYADENQASIGDPVIQPGTFDGGSSPADDLGNLFDFEPIVFSTSANNVIDAAIALSSITDLGNSTPSDGYGTPQSTTVIASVGLKVKKYGRTTGQTKGRISAINATVNVGYSTGVARFVNQIVITPGSFSAGGDSGSLIVVEKGADKGKPVGLLFAGSSLHTIANPIDAVLTRFGVTIDGQ